MRKLNLLLTLVALSLATTSLWADVSEVVDNGKLPGAFSVSATIKVYFSQGNLQYIGSAETPYWKFANEQYEYFGTTAGQNSAATNVDRDLFGWGTKDNPWNTSGTYSEYTWNEWGEHAISNGGNIPNSGWRTLTKSQWIYLIDSRTKATSLRGYATIWNADSSAVIAQGLILLPDNWVIPSGCNFSNTTSNFTTNNYKVDGGWTKMEEAGAVFLPMAGRRATVNVMGVGGFGLYWASTTTDNQKADYLLFHSSALRADLNYERQWGHSVRLVSNTAPRPKASISVLPEAVLTEFTYDGDEHTLISAGTAEGGTMMYSLDGTNWSADLPTATDAGTYTIYYKVQGDASHKDYTPSPNTFNVTISPANIVMPTIETDLIYTGSPQPLLDITGIVGGTIYYSVDGNEPWLTECPSETEIGTYDIWYKVVPDNSNYNSIPATKVTVTIDDPYPFVADNADPSATLTSLLNTPTDLKVKRTIYADDEYNTICLPFSLDESALAASPLAGFNRLKTFKGAQVTGTAPDLYIDIFVEDVTTIEAGIPYLITYPSAHADIVNPVFTGITVTTTEPSAVSVDGITFQGMFAQVHIDPYTSSARDEDYLFLGANSQLYWPSSDQTSSSIKMRGFRAYFIIDRNSISPALAPKGTRARIMDAPKTTTAIDNTSAKFGGSEKIIENGILYIIRNGVKYNAQGQIIK